jgi:hypothetical protein
MNGNCYLGVRREQPYNTQTHEGHFGKFPTLHAAIAGGADVVVELPAEAWTAETLEGIKATARYIGTSYRELPKDGTEFESRN